MRRKKSTKKNNILKTFENLNAIFTGIYFHHKEVLEETIFEISIADRIKLRTKNWM